MADSEYEKMDNPTEIPDKLRAWSLAGQLGQ
jgi:hypothetical protein